jgi:hypothetical protein
MHITITLDDATKIKPASVREAKQPFHNADHLIVNGACPLCGADPFPVIGKIDEQTHTHDTTTAPALSRCCGLRVGTMTVHLSTIFGREEDNAVLNGRPRAY